MECTQRDAIQKEMTPFLHRLICACEDPAVQRQMRVSLTRFQEALLEAYVPDCTLSLHSYLVRNLARFAFALSEALRPDPADNADLEMKRSVMVARLHNASGWQGEKGVLQESDWLERMETWPNCFSLPAAAARLDNDLRAIFNAYYYEGCSFAAIAARCQQSEAWVSYRFGMALEQLSAALVALPLALK